MKRLWFGIWLLVVTGTFCRELCGADKALDLKGVRILVCSPYIDLLALPAVQRLKAAGAEVRVVRNDAIDVAGIAPRGGREPGRYRPCSRCW